MIRIYLLKSALKKTAGFIHLWLGLLSGLVVFIVSATGAALTFQWEIEKHIINPQIWHVEKQTSGHLPLDSLVLIANKALAQLESNGHASVVYINKDSTHTSQIGYNYTDAKEKHHRGYVILNPYTGKVLQSKTGNPDHWIWNELVELHSNLMLGDFGYWCVVFGTLIFLFMVISGIILWWPKNKPAVKQRFWFRWKHGLKWKRKNYDLHNILGFYSCWIVLFMIITGLMWSFEWFNQGVYFITSWGKPLQEIKHPSTGDTTTFLPPNATTFTRAYKTFKEKYPEQYATADYISIGYFNNDKDSLIDIVATYNPTGIREDQFMEAMYNKATGKIHRDNLKNFESVAGTIQASTNEIHYGTFFGLTSKFLTFFGCLIASSLPVSGFYIWWGRRKKKNNKRQ